MTKARGINIGGQIISLSPTIDVCELPQNNIDENAIYRLFIGFLLCDGILRSSDEVICVNELPTEGIDFTEDQENFIVYYNLEDKKVYGYVSSELATTLSILAGWWEIDALLEITGLGIWGNVITNILDSSGYNKIDLMLEYKNYKYANDVGWLQDISLVKANGDLQVLGEIKDGKGNILSNKEDSSNKVTSLSSSSTDTQYPSAKLVYDLIGDIESALITLRGGVMIHEYSRTDYGIDNR